MSENNPWRVENCDPVADIKNMRENIRKALTTDIEAEKRFAENEQIEAMSEADKALYFGSAIRVLHMLKEGEILNINGFDVGMSEDMRIAPVLRLDNGRVIGISLFCDEITFSDIYRYVVQEKVIFVPK